MLHVPPLALITPFGGGYAIEGSANFADAGANHHNWTPAGTGDSRTVMTVEAVFKLFSLATDQHIFAASDGAGNNIERLYIDATGNLHYEIFVGGVTVVHYETTALFRDFSAWYQVVVIRNGNTVTLYVNGTAVTAFDTSDAPTGDNGMFGHTEAHYIGRKPWTTSGYLDLAIARLTYQDGVAASISDYGEAVGNGWSIADASSLSLGTNGVQITGGTDMAAGTLTRAGTAHSVSKTGTVTATNDSPTDDAANGYGNKAVANPLYYQPTAGRLTLSNGNRSWEATTGSYWQNAALTIPVSSGKFIVACSMGDLTSGSVASGIGLSTIASFTPGTGGNAYPGGADFGSDSIGILDRSGVDFNELIHAISGTSTNTGTQLAADDQFVIALDADAGKAWLGWWDDSASQLNWFDSGGTSRSSDEPGSGTNATLTYTAGTQMLFSVFAIVASPTSLPSLLEEADWSFTKPTGFLDLSTENLPAPAVTDPSAYFKTLLYTGNSTGSTAITGCQDASGTNWTPDLVWIKPRTFATDGRHCLYDQVRGANKRISSNNTNDEATDIDCLDSFDSGGFTLGADTANNLVNDSGYTYVAWCLKAGGSGSTNTDGTINTTASVNTNHGGFGIITYTGNGVSGATLGTGMTIPSGTNALAIFKKRSAPNDWHVGYEINGTIGGMELNNPTQDSLVSNAVTNFHSDSGTTITITSGGVVNDTGASYVAYVFQQIPGFCAIGSYTANGNGDGPYVVVDDGGVGFRPAFVLFKDYAGAANWQIMDAVRDPYNPIGSELYPNTSGVESTAGAPFVDFTANGFKCRATGDPNNSGRSYIYLAFAEYPFGGDGVEQARAR